MKTWQRWHWPWKKWYGLKKLKWSWKTRSCLFWIYLPAILFFHILTNHVSALEFWTAKSVVFTWKENDKKNRYCILYNTFWIWTSQIETCFWSLLWLFSNLFTHSFILFIVLCFPLFYSQQIHTSWLLLTVSMVSTTTKLLLELMRSVLQDL